MLLYAAAGFIALGVGMLIYGLAIGRDTQAMAERIMAELRQSQKSIDDPYAKKLREPLTRRILLPALKSAAGFVASVTPKGVLKRYDKMLDMAGRPWGLSAELYAAVKLFSMGLGVAGCAVALTFAPHNPLGRSLATLMPIAAGMMLPDYFLTSRIARRRREFSRVFADVVDLLVISVEAGMGLDGAVQEVVKRRDDVAADELATVLEQIKVGVPRAAAWRQLAERIATQEAATFVAAIVQAEQLGTSIAQVLRAQSEALRTKRSLLIREHAAKMPVKMLFPMIFFIFPCIFIVILGPGSIKILHSLGHL